MRRCAAVLVLLSLAATLHAQGIDRRKDQFPSEFSYFFLPLPYSLPGIGAGWFIPLAFNNMFGTYADTYVVLLTGDATGVVANLEDVHLLSKRLIARVFYQGINRATYRLYTLRGMNTRQEDHQLVELSEVGGNLGELLLTFWERRFELYVNSWDQTVKATAIRDSKGNLLAQYSPPRKLTFSQTIQGVLFDLTDDKYDPRRGVRLRLEYQMSPRKEAAEPSFDVLQWGLTGYVPVGKISTLALHVFRSDAHVTSPGDLDPVTAAQRENCSLLSPYCQALVNNALSHNRNGDAAPLGGQNLLRGYSDARFRGAHTLYYGAEFRWNLTEESTPFDYFIWKDVRTNVQIVFFHEQGSVSETAATLGKEWRADSGAGLRMVSASGTVYRADYAVGDEGPNVTMIINYPF
jgi:hypothetical protein